MYSWTFETLGGIFSISYAGWSLVRILSSEKQQPALCSFYPQTRYCDLAGHYYMVYFRREKREREGGDSEERGIISGTNNGRAKQRPRVSCKAHAGAWGKLYDERNEPAGTWDPIISGIRIMPWATSSPQGCDVHPSVETICARTT